MKEIKFKNMKIKPIFFILLLFAFVFVGGTIAYYTMSSNYENKFKTSYYDVSIEEEFYNNWGTKKVSVVNHDSTPIVIRVSYNERWLKLEDENGIKQYLSNRIYDSEGNIAEVVIKDWTEDWLNKFVDGKDGWYYYNEVLDSNSSVQILNSIIKNPAVFNYSFVSMLSLLEEYDNAAYKLDFDYEAVQASPKAIKSLWGRDVTINDNHVNWNIN